MTIPFTSLRTVRHFGISALIAMGCVAAQATIVNQNFSVTIDNNGTPVAGKTFSGSLSFDDATGTAFGADTLYGLTDFSFAFNGASFNLAALDYGDAVFDGSNMFTGLDASSNANGFSFVPGAFLYDLGNSNAGFGAVGFSANAMPEPGTATLALAALGLLAWSRRRPSRKGVGA